MNQKEFESVINLPANIRYEYFIKKVVDSEEVWGLYENGWSVTEDDEGNKLLPFWPNKEFAEYCATDDWEFYSSKNMDLYEFIDEFLPNLKKEGFKPSIFLNNADSAVLEVDILIEDLKIELEKY
ncbi:MULTISPECIES: DUF2750 domain-containing protein [Paenibacillus]|uniref:DUF2750 domain-containing protein n=1 Tax=Paenibacillus TaxID=44249 RepID=UPI000B8825F5|nr:MULTISPECIES: DUF2750 domain-containing protein [Paenibacillus]MBD8836983.1 DUF2750 domain-containing protein [Paenibacillus sp. CFBP 13594]